MRKKAAILITCLALGSGMLAGCGGADVTESTVELKKDGKVCEYTIEDFSESYYDAEELQNYIKDTVAAYTDSHEGKVKVTKSEVEEQTAYLTVSYDSIDTFRDFSRLDCFAGSIADAQAAGFDFDTDFIQVSADDGDADSSVQSGSIQSIIPFSAIQAEEDMKVFVLGESVDIIVPGEIVYVSADHTRVTSDNTVSVQSDESAENENSLIYVIYK